MSIALLCLCSIYSFQVKSQKTSTLDSLSQKLGTVNTLRRFILGKWQLSVDTNVTWFFKNDSIAYLYYATLPNETDSCSYEVVDTLVVNRGKRKAKFLVLKYKNENKDVEFFKCFGLDEYYMYLEDSNGKYYDFNKK